MRESSVLRGRVTRDGEEDVVEVGAVDRQVLDLDLGVVELLEDAPQRSDAAVAWDLEQERGLVGGGTVEESGGGVQRVRCGELQLDVAAGEPAFKLIRGSFREDLSVVEDRDLVGDVVGLVEVLRREEDRDPVRSQRADRLPHRVAAARIQAGGGPVEEDDKRRAHRCHREVEPAPHPAGVGRSRHRRARSGPAARSPARVRRIARGG
jgi:hypothetical protein